MNKDPSSVNRHIKQHGGSKEYDVREVRRQKRKRGTNIRKKQREEAKKRRIDERPEIVERRGRLGDWEGDTIRGRDNRVRIVTLVDRRSGYLIAYLLPKMRAELLTTLAIKRFQRIPQAKRKTFTLDNGPEFADWERLERQTLATIYFAYPYHSWERGSNENMNGLLRKFFPRSFDFNLITSQELAHVVKRINLRPRKRFNFKSPHHIFFNL